MPVYTCVALAFGDVGAPCDGSTAVCKTGLYCAGQMPDQMRTCQPLASAGSICDEGGNPGGCTPPLACVGDAGAMTCSSGQQGASCLGDIECAPGLACVPGPCAGPGGSTRVGCSPSGTCKAPPWGKPGQTCGSNGVRCLVGLCSNEVGPPGAATGTCPEVIADGNLASEGTNYVSCDTFAAPFAPSYHPMSGVPIPVGTCVLLDSVVCK
jgi:hypothetical protein